MRVLRRARSGMLCVIGTAFVFFCAALHAQTPPASSPTWLILLARADSLRGAAQFDSAQVLLEQALEITERDYGREDTSVAKVLHITGILNFDRGRYADAEPLCRRALTIREKMLGTDHTDVAKSLNFLGNICWIQGRFAEAETLHLRALVIRERVWGLDHPDVAMSLGNLANLYYSQGRYAETEAFCQRALDIRQRLLGPDHPQVALSLNNLSNAYWVQGRFAEAESLQRRALAIREEALGPDHVDVAQSLSNLANIYYDQGRYSEAEPLCYRVVDIRKRVLGHEHPDFAVALNNLANLYWGQGRYADAEPLQRQALAIREKALGPDHLDVAQSLSNLANIYYDEGRYVDGEQLQRRAVAIFKKALGSDHPDLAMSLNNLANICLVQGHYVEAEPLYLQSLDIRRQALGPDHPNVAWSLNNLANLYCAQGRYTEAELLCQQALEIEENAVGPLHPGFSSMLCTRAEVAREQGEFAAAADIESRAWMIRHRNFQDGAAVLAERSALEYSRFLRVETGTYLSILIDAPNGFVMNSAEIARVVLSTKSQVTDGIMARNRAIVQETDPELVALSDSLKQARFALSSFYATGLDEEHPEAFKTKLQSATAEKERLEAELARRSASFAQEQAWWDISAAEVSETMPSGTILIEFVKYEHRVSFRDVEPRYLAIVLKSGDTPSLFPLGAAPVIDTAVLYYQQQFRHVQNLDRAAYVSAADNLYGFVWRPFAALLGDASTVFIAPDGNLNLVSFAGLVDDNGQYLIEKFPIQYLSSGRDLLRLKETAPSGTGLLAMGDPDFDLSPGMSTASAVGLALMTSLNLRSSCEVLSKLNVPRLPGTRNEVEAVAARWTSGGTPAATYLGAEATEENFKQNAPGKRVIHLATHGFYISDECQKKLNTRGAFGMQEGGYVGENPLLLSGFLLAGANKHGEGATEAKREDGIVTAEEVAGINLQGTDLVVLSACETGLGEVKSGEGVYGLRRAFQMAGARTVISALWPIDDQATAEFMGQLFTAQNETLPQTMQRIALSRISSLRSQGKSDHPFFWAGFVATGDWKTR